MGGGDLNLKKSWHPNTMKNQERVWKAEQADAAEKNKLAELQREISDERDREELKRVGQMSGVLSAPDSNKKLEWMYKSSGDLLNREEYLLGRAIDKNFERVEAEEKETLVGVQVHKNHVEHECIPFSIRSYHGVQMSDEQVDLQRKIMEDPLMAIRQREMETRKKLLENPVKLKEIHRLLRNDSDLGNEKEKKTSKKKKKEKKSKKSSKDEANDLDAILAKKYRKIRKETMDDQEDGNVDIDKFLAMKYHQLSNELDKMGGKTSKSKKKTSKDNDERTEEQSNQRYRDSNRQQYDERNRGQLYRGQTYRDRGSFGDSKPDRQQYGERNRGQDYRDRGSFGDSKMDKKPRNYVDGNRHERNQSKSPNREKRDKRYSPVRRNQTSRSTSTSRKNSGAYNRQRDERSDRDISKHERNQSKSPNRPKRDTKHSPVRRRSRSTSTSRRNSAYRDERDGKRERNRRTPSQDRPSKIQRSQDRSGRNRRSPSKERDRRNRRQLSQDNRQSRRSLSEDGNRRRRQSPNKDRDRRYRSRSPSDNLTRSKYQHSNTRRKSRSKSRHDERSSNKIELPTKVPVQSTSRRRSSSSNSSSSSTSSSSNSSNDQEKPKMNYGLVSADGKQIELKNKYQRIEKRDSDKSSTKKVIPVKPKRVALTEEEKEQKLLEMQQNAKIRVIECQQTMERNKKEKMAEEAQLSQSFDKEYINKEMRRALANQFSVESRIKSNINNIQRSGRTMEANFAKR